MARRWAGAILIGLLSGVASSHAQPERSPRGSQGDPFVAVASADPMDLARVVDRLGDDAVLTRLAAGQPRAVRRAAVYAAPFLTEPELALGPLAELAAGRDPSLAPAAAASLLAIARGLDADALERREADPRALAPVRARLAALAGDATARADLRFVAELADASLESVGVPAR